MNWYTHGWCLVATLQDNRPWAAEGCSNLCRTHHRSESIVSYWPAEGTVWAGRRLSRRLCSAITYSTVRAWWQPNDSCKVWIMLWMALCILGRTADDRSWVLRVAGALRLIGDLEVFWSDFMISLCQFHLLVRSFSWFVKKLLKK